MERNYKAFISYRHLPLEMEVAKKIHRRIEHYVIPKELRKNGEKKLGLVFRDQDELPISGSLSNNITEALDHSEYLIVICSPETEKSAWVLREISYFIEKHDRDHVLVVLADGSPETSFPAALTDVVSDSGELLERVEPLAANIAADSRARRNRLFATESLRILAALIGCPYDALYKREQRYKTRRILAAAAAAGLIALGFIGMLLNRNAEIRSNYDQALRNQSNYLASESLKNLEAGDRLSAIALALEALPGEGNERPLVSRAEYALGCAVGAYLSPSNAGTVRADDVFSHAGVIKEFLVNEAGNFLVTLTGSPGDRPIITGWDAENREKAWIYSIESESHVGLAGFLGDSQLVAWSDRGIVCLDYRSGELLWVTTEDDLSNSDYVIVSQVLLDREGKKILALSSRAIMTLDAQNGSLLSTMNWSDIQENGDSFSVSRYDYILSPDGEYLAFMVSGNEDGVAVMDLQDAQIRVLYETTEEELVADDLCFAGDRLYFSTTEMDLNIYRVGHSSVYHKSSKKLFCVDVNSGEILWEREHEYSYPGLEDILRADESLTGKPILVYAYANHVDVMDADSGELLSETLFSSNIVSIDVFNDRVYCIMENGERGTIKANEWDVWRSAKLFVDNIRTGVSQYGNYWVQQTGGEDIIHYSISEADPSWLAITTEWISEEDEEAFYADEYFEAEGCLAIQSDCMLLISDGDPAHPLREIQLPGYGEGSYDRPTYHLGRMNAGRLEMIWTSYDAYGIFRIDPQTLDHETISWEDEELVLLSIRGEEGEEGYRALGYQESGDPEDPEQILSLCTLNSELQLIDQTVFGSYAGLRSAYCWFNGAEDLYVYLPELHELYRLEHGKDRAELCGESLTEVFAAINEKRWSLYDKISESSMNQIAAQTDDRELCVLNDRGELLYKLQGESAEIVSFAYSPDGRYLLTVESDSRLRRYRAEDGSLLGKTELYTAYSSLYDYSEIDWTFTQRGFLALMADRYMNLISLDDWDVFAYVPFCSCYLEDQDFLLCREVLDGNSYGGFHRHTLDSLIEYGRDLLNGWELSEAQRLDYGLDESRSG